MSEPGNGRYYGHWHELFPRITFDPKVMGGKACIRGQRVTVSMILGQLGAGLTREALLADYPYLEPEDIDAALNYAAWLTRAHEVDLIGRTAQEA
ncbi:MAG TPA: DUF433 domain-containing protein [Beijerinckia sp.]|jgi:uncharacterized protein (DUF433 family)|nr:DUF433 domain-containing protein [Beijerinckia sp.]